LEKIPDPRLGSERGREGREEGYSEGKEERIKREIRHLCSCKFSLKMQFAMIQLKFRE